MLDPVDVTTPQRYAPLRRGAVPQHPLERRASAQERRRSVSVGRRDHCAGGDQAIEHVGHLCPKNFDHLAAEGVGVVELHDALAVPRGIRLRARWTGVAVDNDHFMTASRQRDGGEQSGGTRPDYNSSHMRSN